MMQVAGCLIALLPALPWWLALRRLGLLGATERIASAFGFGLGASSIGFFLARWLGLSPCVYLAAESVTWLVAAWVVGRTTRERDGVTSRDQRPPSRRLQVHWTVPLVLVAVGIGTFARYELTTHPFGLSDTWAIWNVRAAFLAAPGPHWRDVFTPGVPLSHQDYPLLLPAAVARLWSLVGQTPEPSGYLSVAVLVATTLVVSGSVARRVGFAPAVASLGLLLTPEFVRQGATQHADLLVGFYTVLGVVLAVYHPKTSTSIIASGLACGLAAWSKNEGLVPALLIPILTVVWKARSEGRGIATSVAADFAIGMGPVLAVLILFKILLAPDNDVVSGLMTPGVERYWMDSVRVSFVARQMFRGLWEWGAWPVVPAIAAVAVVAVIPKSPSLRPAETGAAIAVVLLGVQATVFFAIYVMTPHSVAWHIGTSWSRLVAQLWPTLVWWSCVSRSSRPRA